MLRSGARFLAGVRQKGNDGKYSHHSRRSLRELGFTVDYRLNKDCILDLALTQFLLNAVVEAPRFGTDESERAQWKEIAANLGPIRKSKARTAKCA